MSRFVRGPRRAIAPSKVMRAFQIGALCLGISSFPTAYAQSSPPTPIPVDDLFPLIYTTGTSSGPKTKLARRFDTQLIAMREEHRRFVARTRLPGERFQSAVRGARLSSDEYVLIDAVASQSASALLSDLSKLGLRQGSRRGRIVSGWIPVSALETLPGIVSLRHARLAMFARQVGAVTSQGDTALGTAALRTAMGLNGAGVTIGTLSDSYNCKGSAAIDVSNNDLPAGVVVLEDLSGSVCAAGGTDEGRAMMQIEHDLAPNAALAFHTGDNGSADYANGILALRQTTGAKIIVDDLIYFAEPMFQDGPIAQAVDAVVQQGAAYFSAAGNQASQSYESAFRGSGVISPVTHGERHDFDPGSGVTDLQAVTIPVNSTVYIVLQWNQPFYSVSGAPGASTDLDLVLYDNANHAVALSSTNNVGSDPVEVIGYTNTGSNTTFKIGIERKSGPAPSLIKYVWFGSMTPQQFATNSSSVYGHANASGARAVGASYYLNTPAFGINPPVLNGFSSLGGTTVLYDTAGNAINSPRLKPEIVATDGVDTTFFGTDTDGSGYPNFFGTSAAAPHAAAVAALLMQGVPTAMPLQIYQALQETTIDMGAAGFDFQSGSGLIQAGVAYDYLTHNVDSSEIGFSSTPDSVPTLGSISTAAYASQGLTLAVSDRSDGFATLSAPPTAAIGGFSGASLRATGSAGAASIALNFSEAVTQVSFAMATASGQVRVELQNAAGQTIQWTTFDASTSIPFSDATLQGGVVTLPDVAGVARIVVTTTGSDTDLRLDSLQFTLGGTVATSHDIDAPLPAWSLALLGFSLLAILRRHRFGGRVSAA